MTVVVTQPDDATLRRARRARVLAAMEEADVDFLIVGREGNARYVSGAPRLWTAGSRAFGPGCVFVRASGEVHLLSTWDEGIPEEIPHENLYGITFNAMNFVTVLSRIDGAATARRVATDSMSGSSANLLPKAFPAAEFIDGEPMLRQIRRVKSPEEIEAIRASVRVAEEALAVATKALVPGVTERKLTAIFKKLGYKFVTLDLQGYRQGSLNELLVVGGADFSLSTSAAQAAPSTFVPWCSRVNGATGHA